MQPESWDLLSKTPDTCVVAREVGGRMTVWTLQDRGKGWRIYAIRFSKQNPGANLTPERMKQYASHTHCKRGKGLCQAGDTHRSGIKLTVNRLDTILSDYCEGRRA